jgi:hypothetical protein
MTKPTWDKIFYAILSCHSERSKESRIVSGSITYGDKSEMFRFAQHDSAVK